MPSGLVFQQTFAEGDGGRFGAVCRPDLGEKHLDVLLDAVFPDAEPGGDFLVGPPARNCIQYLVLAGGELRDWRIRRKMLGDVRRDDALA